MDDAGDGQARAPQLEDLVRICRALNEAGARYLLIGGFAVIAHGGGRTTRDIDFLIDDSPENVARVKRALSVLADNAAVEVRDRDVREYQVVRVADEVVVDLMGRACGISYEQAATDRAEVVVADVPIPVASPRTLIQTKQTVRPSDHADIAFLRTLLPNRSR